MLQLCAFEGMICPIMRNPTWRILSIGYLSQNHYRPGQNTIPSQECTCTLIETGRRRIIVDPGLESPEILQEILLRRCGYTPDRIDTVFLTHFHRHHWRCLNLFRKSAWLMSKNEIRWWQGKPQTTGEEQDILARMVPAEDFLIDGIDIMPTPGHTHGLTSLVFETREGIVVVAGDAVLTFDHFDDREPAEHSEDAKTALQSINQIAKMADIVVPGHDNFFVV